MNRSVIVIGAGVGGLVTAIELAAQGLAVTLCECAATPGGKLREVSVGGVRLDAGPTVVTLRWVFEEVFAAAGVALCDHLTLKPAEVLARHAWEGGARLDLFAESARSADAIAAFAGPAEGRRYLAFCAEARGIFETLRDPFIRGSRPTPAGLMARVGRSGLGGLWQIKPYGTLWSVLAKRFTDPRLRQLFGRYATYSGSSPFLAPATLMLIAHVEQEGVWLVEGGMHRLAQALAGLAEGLGTRIRYGAEVTEILVESKRAVGVRLAGGEDLRADAVVFNGDAQALPSGRLGAAARRAVPASSPSVRSLSALTWNMVAKTAGFPLVRHTVFFSSDYKKEFDELFAAGRLPTQPTVYICAQDRDDQGNRQSGGPERLLCLVNAPANGDSHPYSPTEVEQCAERTFSLLNRCGLQIEQDPVGTQVTSPADFTRLFPATGGALYGRNSHGWQASFKRPGARSALPGLYLTGGSTHPGAGVPMAALSGRLAASCVLADLATI
ncbi:MAG TPA: phytoene desaturase family protein [Lamprocystis sp. (in: g-proteobacteria)]|nr:phytoene desaturase family protein [Lamprocystis sp. (in: g-proteobacteria)]